MAAIVHQACLLACIYSEIASDSCWKLCRPDAYPSYHPAWALACRLCLNQLSVGTLQTVDAFLGVGAAGLVRWLQRPGMWRWPGAARGSSSADPAAAVATVHSLESRFLPAPQEPPQSPPRPARRWPPRGALCCALVTATSVQARHVMLPFHAISDFHLAQLSSVLYCSYEPADIKQKVPHSGPSCMPSMLMMCMHNVVACTSCHCSWVVW